MLSTLLLIVRNDLRSFLNLASDQCGIQIEGIPPPAAGELYVAISDRGVTSGSAENLRETAEIEVSLWRRLSQFPADRQGELNLPEDPLLPNLATLDALERSVISRLHGNYTEITTALNNALAVSEPGGAIVQFALAYRGRARGEKLSQTHRGGQSHWLGRRLLFGGLTRVY